MKTSRPFANFCIQSFALILAVAAGSVRCMDFETFASLAKHVFPDATSSRLARARNTDQRVCQRWLAGQVPVPDDVADWITEQARIAGELQLQAELDTIGLQWKQAGLHDEAIAAALASYYQHVVDRRIV